jgi:hypothetical protein
VAKLPVTHKGLFSYAPTLPLLSGDFFVVGGEGGGSLLVVVAGLSGEMKRAAVFQIQGIIMTKRLAQQRTGGNINPCFKTAFYNR